MLKVAADRTFPNGQVIGIDIIPAQPPKGVSTIQGNFLSQGVQEEAKSLLRERNHRKPRNQLLTDDEHNQSLTEEELGDTSFGYLDMDDNPDEPASDKERSRRQHGRQAKTQVEGAEGRLVDIVLSDMSEPWEQTTGFWKKSLSDPYYRMMNTSGLSFRDHAGSMVRPDPGVYGSK